MPIGFLTQAERERLRRFPEHIPEDDLSVFFLLSETDQQAVNRQQEDHTRLGFALQLCTLRYLGFVPHDLGTAPSSAIAYVAEQLGVPPEAIQSYGSRIPTLQPRFDYSTNLLLSRKDSSMVAVNNTHTEQELVEQRGADGVQRVIALPLGQLLHPFAFLRVADHVSQHWQQGCQQARAIGGRRAQLQLTGGFDVPLGLFVAQLQVELLAAVGEVVVARDLDAAGGYRLEIRRDDIASGRIFFLRVVTERVETVLLRLRAAAIEHEARFRARRK